VRLEDDDIISGVAVDIRAEFQQGGDHFKVLFQFTSIFSDLASKPTSVRAVGLLVGASCTLLLQHRNWSPAWLYDLVENTLGLLLKYCLASADVILLTSR